MMLALSTKTVIADSPIAEGVYSLSGSVSYNKSYFDGQQTQQYSIRPGFLYFMNPKLGVGLYMSYSRRSGDTSKSITYGLAPTIRYYFITSDLYPFTQFSYARSRTKRNDTFFGRNNDFQSMSLAFGIDYFISRSVSIEPKFEYSRRRTDCDQCVELKYTNVSFFIGITAFIN